MKILITGGAGFIGSHTADALFEEGHEIRILDNLSKPVHLKGRPGYLREEYELIEGDVRDPEALARALKGIDAVYHLAAYQDYMTDFSKFFDVNSRGTALLYEMIVENRLRVKKIIIASSQSVVGEGRYLCPQDGLVFPDNRSADQLSKGIWDIPCPVCKGPIIPQSIEETDVNPGNPYGVSKLTQEMIGFNLGRRYEIPTVCMRYSIVQGPRQSFYNAYSGACRIFCLSLHLGKAPAIYEDGLQLRDFVNIRDVVRANLLVLKDARADFEAFHVGGGKAHTVLDFYQTVCGVFGKDLPAEIPGTYRFGDTRHTVSSINKMASLGWQPEYNTVDSVTGYKQWLESAGNLEDLLDDTQQQMRSRSVLRTVQMAGL